MSFSQAQWRRGAFTLYDKYQCKKENQVFAGDLIPAK